MTPGKFNFSEPTPRKFTPPLINSIFLSPPLVNSIFLSTHPPQITTRLYTNMGAMAAKLIEASTTGNDELLTELQTNLVATYKKLSNVKVMKAWEKNLLRKKFWLVVNNASAERRRQLEKQRQLQKQRLQQKKKKIKLVVSPRIPRTPVEVYPEEMQELVDEYRAE